MSLARRLLQAALAVASVAFSLDARATNVTNIEHAAQGKVFITYAVNHNYYEEGENLRLKHEAPALADMRSMLVKLGRLRDLPVLVEIAPAFLFEGKAAGSITRRKACSVDPGVDAEEEGRSIGPCYALTFSSTQLVHRWSRALLLAAKDLAEGASIEAKDIAEIEKRAGALQIAAGIVRDVDPVRSADGRLRLSTIWRDGDLSFSLRDDARKRTSALPPLDGYLAARPLFSPSGRYVAYASLRQIQVFDVMSRTSVAIRVPPATSSTNEIHLSFDEASGRLLFAVDLDLRSHYATVSADLKTGATTLIRETNAMPAWPPGP